MCWSGTTGDHVSGLAALAPPFGVVLLCHAGKGKSQTERCGLTKHGGRSSATPNERVLRCGTVCGLAELAPPSSSRKRGDNCRLSVSTTYGMDLGRPAGLGLFT